MKLKSKPILVLSVLAFALSNMMPADALIGRLSGHSAGAVKRFQQAAKNNHQSKRVSHTLSLRHKRGHATRGIAQKVQKKSTKAKAVAAAVTRSTYLWTAPLATKALSAQAKESIKQDFWSGNSDQYSTPTLLSADVVASCPLHGGVFNRREPVKFVVLHSTETGRAADAQRVIASWNNRGMRHPGAQFVVDRDGVIYCTADPVYGTVHVNQNKTLNGVNNDNSVGIEMVRAGDQQYTKEQMRSIVCLVHYLQGRFNVANDHVYGHGQIQPSDRTDPVNFNWQTFVSSKDILNRTASIKRHIANAG